MRADYFDRFADAMPTLSRMRKEGAWFSSAHVTSLPTVTGVGHATIGTGSDPRFHGITVNNLFNTSYATGFNQTYVQGINPATSDNFGPRPAGWATPSGLAFPRFVRFNFTVNF